MAHLTPKPEKVVFTSEVAGTCPTRAEIDAGTVLDDAEMSGWKKATNLIDVSDGSSRQGKTTPGTQRRLGDPKLTSPATKSSLKAPLAFCLSYETATFGGASWRSAQ